jgi:amino acid transporter
MTFKFYWSKTLHESDVQYSSPNKHVVLYKWLLFCFLVLGKHMSVALRLGKFSLLMTLVCTEPDTILYNLGFISIYIWRSLCRSNKGMNLPWHCPKCLLIIILSYTYCVLCVMGSYLIRHCWFSLWFIIIYKLSNLHS